MTETDVDRVCEYCAHPAGMHPHGTRQGCWGEVRALDGGWRTCTCSGYVEAGAA